MSKNKRRKTRPRNATSFQIEQLEPRQLLAADISIDWNELNSQPLLGETVDVSFQFANSGDATGYGPFIDLTVPSGSDGGGLDYVKGSASLLGADIKETIVPFDANGLAMHPFAVDDSGNAIVVLGEANDQLVVLELPLGSFTENQPDLQVEMRVAVDTNAEMGESLQLTASSGFRYGNDPSDNVETDPMHFGETSVLSVTPEIIRSSIEYLGSENETATGENFVRSYRISFDAAEGAKFEDLKISSLLDSNQVFSGIRETSWGNQSLKVIAQPTIGEASLAGEVVLAADSWTGIAGIDGSFVVDFYVPQTDAGGVDVIDLVTAIDSVSSVTTSVSGNWNQQKSTEGRSEESIAFVSTPVVHQLQAELLTVQQSVRILSDQSANSLGPDDLLEYRIDFQLSDYAVVDDLTIQLTVPDGQMLDSSRIAALTLNGVKALNGENLQIKVELNKIESLAGSQVYLANISQALTDAGMDTKLFGGATVGGAGDAVIGVITYLATVQDQFSGPVPSGDASVDEGDLFQSAVTATAVTIDQTTGLRTEYTTGDSSGATRTINVSNIATSLFAINGEQSPQSTAVGAGDLVTYRITRDVNSSDIENLIISDYLPLPVFTIDGMVWSTDTHLSENTIEVGPNDSFHQRYGSQPAIAIDSQNNRFSLNYGDFDWKQNQSAIIDLLVTVRVQDRPFADGMWLNAMANSSQSSTNNGYFSSNALTDIQYTRPVLMISKSVVGSDNPAATLIASSQIGTDVQNVDAGDRVRFEVTIENTGLGQNGAFDVWLKDRLPTGFEIPAAGLNLQVKDGNGNAVDYVGKDSNSLVNLLGEGIELVGTIGASNSGDGNNQVTISYELVVSHDTIVNSVHSSSASIVNYSAIADGENYVTSSIEDDAVAQLANATLKHSVVDTDQAHTTNRNVVVGETVTYKAVIQIPEGTMNGASLQFAAPRGLSFNELIGVKVSDKLELDGQGVLTIIENASITSDGNGVRNEGRLMTLEIGNIGNTDSNNSTVEYVEVIYTATITNDTNVNANRNLRSVGTWTHSSGKTAISSNSVKVLEPNLTVVKSWSASDTDAQDRLSVTLTIVPTQKYGTTAFDIVLQEDLADGTTYVPGSLRWISGAEPGELGLQDGSLNATWDSISITEESVLVYDVVVNDDVAAGAELVNEATISWSSLEGDPGHINLSNGLSYERTGDTADIGGFANDYVGSFQSTISVAPVRVSMDLTETSHSHTAGGDLTIGEQAEYEVVLTVPEGVHKISLAGLDIGNASLISPLSLTILSIGSNLQLENGGVGTQASPDENGDLVFDFGTVKNLADNRSNAADQIVLRMNAIIPDVLPNQSGDIATVAAKVDFQLGTSEADADMTIVEPSLIVRQILSNDRVDAAETVDVTISIEHINQTTSTAFSLNLVDSLASSGLNLVPGSIVVAGGTLVNGNQFGDEQIEIVADSLSSSNVIEISYQTIVGADVKPGTTLVFGPSLAYASIEGQDGRTYATSTSSQLTVNASAISGKVFTDENQDGIEQFEDHGINDVTVTLVGEDHLGNSVNRVTQTLATGAYRFDGLRPGNYSLVESQPKNVADGADFAGSLGGVASQDRVDSIVISNGQYGEFDGYIFSESPLTWIEGTVFVDENEDGTLGKDENGIEGVEIFLTGFDSTGDFVSRTTSTNERGYYVFQYLAPGTYDLVEGQTEGYFDAAEQLGSNGGQAGNDYFSAIEIAPMLPGKMYNFGEYAPGSVNGQVYIDYDRDDVLDRKDGLVAGVQVTLDGVNDLGETISLAQQTDIDGFYHFVNLRPGDYHVSSERIEGLNSGVSNVGWFLGKSGAVANNGIGIENGFDGIRLPAGSNAVAYNVGHVDPLFLSTIAGTQFDASTVIYGSSSDDNFVVHFSENGTTVEVDGVEHSLSSDETRSLRLLGSFGHDTLSFTGSESKETIELRKHSARITGTWFETLIYGMEDIQFIGGGNEDLARFYDTDGDDQFDAQPFSATMTGAGYRNSVEGVHRIYSYFTTGFDEASFVGKEGSRDNFTATPLEAKMYDHEFYVFAKNYDAVKAAATDSLDRAYLYGSTEDDRLTAGERSVALESDNYRIDVENYAYSVVSSQQGGNDSASLVGSAGDDELSSRPTGAIFDVNKSRVIAKGFDFITATANGGNDVARVNDSHYDDLFHADATKAKISNSINETTMIGFAQVYASMLAGGTDTAVVEGSNSADVFKASPTHWSMTGGGVNLSGEGFTSVSMTGESNDRAYLYDSAYDDTLELSAAGATLRGQRFSNSATGFGKINSEASNGNDRIVFTDTSARSTIRMNEQKATIFGAGFSYNATGFDALDAWFSDLNGKDNLDLDGRIDYDLLEVDLVSSKYKLSLAVNESSKQTKLNARVNNLL